MTASVRVRCGSGSPYRTVLLPLALLCGMVFALGGCAASRTPGPRPPTPSDDPLPGAGRALPSEENRVEAAAPPAFPNYPADLSSAGAPVPPLRPSPVSPGGGEPTLRPAESYTVQLQAASTAERAKEWEARASTIFRAPVRVDAEEGLHKLRVGMYTSAEAAEQMRRDAVAAGYVDAIVVVVAGPVDGGGSR